MSAAAMKRSGVLSGLRIVVTRPAHQAGHLAAAIAAAGGEALLFPLLVIRDVADPAALAATADRLESYDLAVFVSPNAVERALPLILAQRAWPPAVAVATMGASSERALARFGVAPVLAPRLRFDSEALLALPELQRMTGRRVIIFRGDGGRELLGETLAARGAQVDYASCYRREKPSGDAARLREPLVAGAIDAIVVSSSEGLRNLCELLDAAGRAALARTPLFVPHARIGAEAARLGLARVTVTAPGDEGVLAGLAAHFEAPVHGH